MVRPAQMMAMVSVVGHPGVLAIIAEEYRPPRSAFVRRCCPALAGRMGFSWDTHSRGFTPGCNLRGFQPRDVGLWVVVIRVVENSGGISEPCHLGCHGGRGL